MAIDKLIPTDYGTSINTEHHLVPRITIDKITNAVEVRVESYISAADYNAGGRHLAGKTFTVKFSDLPSAVQQAGLSFVQSIEDAVIVNIDKFSGGTRVNDDGTPVT